MKIKALTRFKHDKWQFLKDVVYEVDSTDGAYFIKVGWAEKAAVNAEAATIVPPLGVDPDTIYAGTKKRVFDKTDT